MLTFKELIEKLNQIDPTMINTQTYIEALNSDKVYSVYDVDKSGIIKVADHNVD